MPIVAIFAMFLVVFVVVFVVVLVVVAVVVVILISVVVVVVVLRISSPLRVSPAGTRLTIHCQFAKLGHLILKE